MDFDSWTVNRVDTVRLRRLAVGAVFGGATVVAWMAFVILTSKGVAASEEEVDDGPIEVSLASEVEVEPPPPPPEPKADKPKPRPKLETPTTISDEKLEEKDAPKDLASEEKMVQEVVEAKPAVVEAPVEKAPPPKVVKVKPAVKKPVRLTEDMPKPVQLVMKTPDYPSSAKAAGIEGTVIVKYVIGEDGSVRDVKALKGPPELTDAAVEAVKTWRFQPILVDGAPVAVVRIARFPFRLK